MLCSFSLIFFGFLFTFPCKSELIEAPQNSDNNLNEHYTVCKKHVCQNVGKFIAEGMNKTVDPCEDFYSYVCGLWPVKHPVPPMKEKWNVHEMISQRVQTKLKKILEEDITSSDTEALKIEKQWYKACMDEERLKKKGLKPVVKIVENIGGWPMTRGYTEWNEKKFPWQKVAKYFASFIGEYSLFSFGKLSDPSNSSVNILTLDQPSDFLLQTLLPPDIENDHDNDVDFKEEGKLLMKVAKSYAKSSRLTTEISYEEVQKVMKFKQILKKIKSFDPDTDLSPMTIDELQQFYDKTNPVSSTAKIDWLEMIHDMLMNSGLQINGDEKILLLDKAYTKRLAQLLDETPQRTVVNYISWEFVKDSLKYLDKEKRQWYSDVLNKLFGIKQIKERWEYCVEHMPLYYGNNHAYVKKYFPENLLDTATKLGAELRKEVKQQINSSSWMDEKTKIWSKEKLDAMKFYIGYPDSYKNESFLNHVYDGLKLGPNYFTNVLNYFTHGTEEAWRSFRNPIQKNVFGVLPKTVNAVNYLPDNAITIPAAELKLPLFNAMLPTSVNYGSIGFIMAHEIFHSFDNEGREYDKNGNYGSWWSEKMIRAFKERTKCFVDQFNDYKVDGDLTEGENIADTAGLITAFEVYKNKMKEEEKEDKRLPGLEDVNEEQLYFISFAATFCSTTTPEYEEILKKRDRHSAPSFRINGAVSNSKEFSRIFKCSKSSPMNPDHKCNILA